MARRARSVARRTQTAVRMAIGASRSQIVTQALVESICADAARSCSERPPRAIFRVLSASGAMAVTKTDGVSTSWGKIKNPDYSQMIGRREVFEARRDQRQARRRDWSSPVLW